VLRGTAERLGVRYRLALGRPRPSHWQCSSPPRHSNADAKSINRKLVDLEAELAQAPAADAIAVHPNAPERYRAKVAQIHEALKKGRGAAQEAIQLLT
jgi:hypothetical protein